VMAPIRDQAFRDFVFAMHQTGCRRSEVARVSTSHVNPELDVWVFGGHETVKTGKRGSSTSRQRWWKSPSAKWPSILINGYATP
jgi:hypothetical protein